jgi:hypothetical protein
MVCAAKRTFIFSEKIYNSALVDTVCFVSPASWWSCSFWTRFVCVEPTTGGMAHFTAFHFGLIQRGLNWVAHKPGLGPVSQYREDQLVDCIKFWILVKVLQVQLFFLSVEFIME